MVDISRNTSGVVLPAEVSNEIWGVAANGSAVMKHAQKVTLPGSGSVIQVVTGLPEAQWVNETAKKPVDRGTFASKTMKAHKMAVIVPFSDEFVRDSASLYNEVVRQLPEALAIKFDQSVLHGVDAPSDGFDNLSGAPEVSLADDTYAGLVDADTKVALAGGVTNGYVLAPQGRGIVLGSVDGAGRPLFTPSATEGLGNVLLGSPVSLSRAAANGDTVGIAGDWTSARYGVVDGIKVTFSKEATLTDGAGSINLFEQNMIAARVEFEVGFVVSNVQHFARLTNTP